MHTHSSSIIEHLDARSAAGTMKRMVVLTQEARAKLVEFQSLEADAAGKPFRVRVDAGGCSGFTYEFTFDAPRDGDVSFDCEGITVLVDTQSLPFLMGATIDYLDDFQQSGFVVQNPNSTASCGCGKSFGV